MPPRTRLLAVAACATALAASAASSALAADQTVAPVDYPGVQHLHYRYGPITITPGQNTIVYRPSGLKPKVPGYITRFRPDLKYTDGRTPRVDILHLHHGVWLMNNYPVWEAQRGGGKNGRYTFPDDARGAERKKTGEANEMKVPFDATLVAAGGHLHPGGLYVDLKQTRGDQTKEIFRSEAKYFEPAGAVSWDVAMTFTKPDWRVSVKKGDRLNVSATYDTKNASWYEVMGIMDPIWFSVDPAVTGKDPFAEDLDWHGVVTHGHLPENDNHGGTGRPVLPDVTRMLSAHAASTGVDIRGFVYDQGDMSLPGAKGRPPVIRPGGTLTFRNLDSPKGGDPNLAIYHTITACANPCNKAAGIAYPVANGKRSFDSGELGFGPRIATAAEQRATWKTPKDLDPGTYSYFCRVHPFMRGSFRVVPR